MVSLSLAVVGVVLIHPVAGGGIELAFVAFNVKDLRSAEKLSVYVRLARRIGSFPARLLGLCGFSCGSYQDTEPLALVLFAVAREGPVAMLAGTVTDADVGLLSIQ